MNLHTLPHLPASALHTISTRQEEACFVLLAVNGGLAGGFGSVYCAHIFANAQTGNLISLASELFSGQWPGVLARLGGLGLYLLGIVLTVVLPMRLFGGDTRRWQRACLLVEAALFAVQGLLPRGVLGGISDALYLWPVFLACALQYNTFTALHGVPVSTVFCTNNLRQMALHAMVWRSRRRAAAPEAAAEAGRELRISLTYLAVTALFFVGILASIPLSGAIGPGVMFVCAALLFALWLWRTLDHRE